MFKNLLTLIVCLLGVSAWGQLVNDGATITIQSGATLVVEGDVTNQNSGTITNNGTLKVAGALTSTAGTLTSTTGNIEFQGATDNTVNLGANLEVNNFTINKTGGNVVFSSAFDVTVKGALDFMTDGLIDINGTDLLLEAGITGSSASRFVQTDGAGFLSKVNQSGSFTFPVGFSSTEYNPATINNTGTAGNIGVRSLEDAYDNGASGVVLDDVITASWEVTGGDANALNATLNWDAGDEGTNWDASISGVAQWQSTYWDHTLDGIYGGGNSATRTGVSAGLFAVGGKSVMDHITVLPKVFLSGAFNGTDMNDDLRIVGDLPLTEPYTALSGFTHSGLGGGEAVSMYSDFDQTGTNDDIVDWVFVEIRDAAGTTKKTSMSALLQRDGDIVDVNMQPLEFKGIKSNDDYRITVRHRNHVGVLSASSQTLQRTNTILDYTSNSALIQGGLNGINALAGGKFGLFSGDHNSDGQIQTIDLQAIYPNLGIGGYEIGDMNLNSQVQTTDLQILYPSLGKGAQYTY